MGQPNIKYQCRQVVLVDMHPCIENFNGGYKMRIHDHGVLLTSLVHWYITIVLWFFNTFGGDTSSYVWSLVKPMFISQPMLTSLLWDWFCAFLNENSIVVLKVFNTLHLYVSTYEFIAKYGLFDHLNCMGGYVNTLFI